MRFRLFIILVILLASSAAAARQTRRSIWSGVYTNAQADRGKEEYQKTCVRCHAASLDGVQDANLLGDFAPRFSLRGTDFMERWREDTAQSLFDLIKKGMPPRNEPKAPPIVDLSDEAYLGLVAFIFQGNGFPAGDSELNVNYLRNVRIQERSGPRALPSFSVVQAVGCLTQHTPGSWQLSAAAEPIRIRELTAPTDADIAASAQEGSGNLEFDLQNIGYLGREFDTASYEGYKMQARGILIRQPPNVRIDVRSLVEVSPSCP
jgi:S-disulfanyl-L-cysteine oxidoreductase SoxD